MSDKLFLRALYHPSQPAENASGKGKLLYKEFAPCLSLQPYIHCFWELSSPELLNEPYLYRVIADGCIDLLMDNNDFNGILIAGITDSAFDIPMKGNISYFGIRFLPGCSRYFFRFPASVIANQMVAGGEVLDKRISDFAATVFERKGIAGKIEVAEKYLLARLFKLNVSLHPSLSQALESMLRDKTANMETDATGWISPRQLRRLFHDHVGCSPKLFSRIARFQQTLYTLQFGKETAKQNAFYDHGYFDQSHFIKEFKIFYGETPSALKK